MAAGPRAFKVLILGGTGVFGSRLCERLVGIPSLDITVAGRDAVRAERLAQRLREASRGAQVVGRAVPIDDGLREHLSAARPDVVVHAAGPFQGQDYRVAEACLASGSHYVDLADGREFVTGFDRLDRMAKAARRLAITGASSVPGLSSAAVDALSKGFRSLESIRIGISPGNRAPRGLAVIESILSYSGQPFPSWRNGAMVEVFGWQGLRRRSLPGLGSRWFCDCDVPDVALFPSRYDGVREVRFQAGLELSVLHLGLWGLSGLVRLGLLPNLRRFAAPFRRMADWFEGFGTDKGGMYVEVTGRDGRGDTVTRAWSLVAESGHGPYVPIVPAVILVRKLAGGVLTEWGARPCMGLFDLRDFAEETSDLAISTETW